ncbi:MAG: glycosyltransferase family 39 protein [Proteobacteria bacterium]|nr:glycosyltransferase family 39 protein [Pseudomonadota bacterium]
MQEPEKKWQILLETRYLVFFSIVIELILFYFYYYPESKILFGDEVRYLNTGIAIAGGADWHSNPLWPPMQGVVIAAFVKVFNHPILPLQIFQYGLLLIAGFIVRDIVFRETNHKLAAQVALAIMIVYPSWLAYSQYLWPEVMHVTLLVAIFWVINYKYNSYRWMLFSGVLIGTIILFKSLILLFIPVLYLPLFYKLRLPKAILFILLSMVMAIIVVTPATQKTHKLTASWMVANSSMFNLWLGLHDDSRQHFANKLAGQYHSRYMASADNYQQRNNIAQQKTLDKIQQDGYLNTIIRQISKQYFRLFDHQTFFSQQFTGTDKNLVNAYSQPRNTILVWLVVGFNNIMYLCLMLTLGFGIFAAVKSSIIAQQFLLFGLYVAGLFLFLHVIPRFRIPLVPIMAFFSAYAYYYLQQNKFINLTQNKAIIIIMYVTAVTGLVFAGGLIDKYL